MKNLFFFLLILAGCTSNSEFTREKMSLAGEWKFKIDSLDQGINDKWYDTLAEEKVNLPGSMAENGKGYEVDVNTDWTGSIVDRSYFTEKKYEKYRQPGNIKIPFWLKPVKYYKGVAWYQKEVEIPEGWVEKHITLFLERCHWESTVFVNGKGAGSKNSLATPHEYEISDLLVPGKNLISVRIDNRIIIPVGVNSHSISDHTQSNWNGIAGDISLRAISQVYISAVSIYPDLQNNSAKVIVTVTSEGKVPFEGKLLLAAESFNTEKVRRLKRMIVRINSSADRTEFILDYPMGNNFDHWSEFNPAMYKMSVNLKNSDREIIDSKTIDFGMREFKANGKRFEVNGRQVFLRGTTECCIFPLTGYPPSDVISWEKVLKVCKDYGLNHIRFHSYCPPEAAFIAADKLGIYFHVECSSWANQGSSIGDGGPLDQFIYDESEKIIMAYGNHPSFCMLAYGNEPAGRNQNRFLGDFINYWKAIDNRHVYTSAAGWPVIPENDYNLIPAPRIQQWGQGLKSIINAQPPQSMYDFRDVISRYDIPVVGHEIGQWCVYPDFKEIGKYTGPLKAINFEIFRTSLNENNMGDQAEDFLMASGKLQVLCYKADIEAALRTPDYGGFEILQLHDFPGQGTALVGILNPFFESKGYVTPEEFRMFCSETVPLARMQKMIYLNTEQFKADIEVAHFGEYPLKNPVFLCSMLNNKGDTIHREKFSLDEVEIGNCIPVGSLTLNLSDIKEAQKLVFEVSVENSSVKNQWDIWVYPVNPDHFNGDILVTGNLDSKAQEKLKEGGSVLLLTFGKIGNDMGSEVAVGFSSIFWNTAWTNNQPPHTLGILCDPKHPLFKDFPTEYHSNWQWWDPVTHSQAMILDGFPPALKPLIQPIDTWFENRRLALAFESESNGGKLMVCSIDMVNIPEDRVVSGQLLKSVLEYMNSESFNPQIKVDINIVRRLIQNK
jgi:hypothetical protein